MNKEFLEAEIIAYLEDLIDISVIETIDFNKGKDFEKVAKKLDI